MDDCWTPEETWDPIGSSPEEIQKAPGNISRWVPNHHLFRLHPHRDRSSHHQGLLRVIPTLGSSFHWLQRGSKKVVGKKNPQKNIYKKVFWSSSQNLSHFGLVRESPCQWSCQKGIGKWASSRSKGSGLSTVTNWRTDICSNPLFKRWPFCSVIQSFRDKWDELPLFSCCEIPNALDLSELLSERRHSPTREELESCLHQKNPGAFPLTKS